jgi:hypothetical protein
MYYTGTRRKNLAVWRHYFRRLQAGSLHTVVRLRSQSGQSFTRIQLIMDRGISSLPGLSLLSHLVACIIHVSLTYIYNAWHSQSVYKISAQYVVFSQVR